MKVLIVEDEEAIANLIKINLTAEGYHCTCAYDGKAGADYLEKEAFDLILLDIMLPEIDGYELLEYIKPFGTPVIFMTAKGAVNDRIRGLKLGADDYIIKPFSIKVLMEKIQAVLRRCYGAKKTVNYYYGNLSIDLENHIVKKNGQMISLTPTEFELLEVFCKSKGQILTKDILLERIWDVKENYVNEHTLSLNVSRLRNKIEDENHGYIKTIYGLGYKWTGENG